MTRQHGGKARGRLLLVEGAIADARLRLAARQGLDALVASLCNEAGIDASEAIYAEATAPNFFFITLEPVVIARLMEDRI